MLNFLRKLFGDTGAPNEAESVNFRALMEHSSDLILQVGQDFKLRYVSPSSEFILGWKPEEMLRDQEKLLHPDDLPNIGASMMRLAAGEVSREQLVYRVKNKAGDWVWMEGSSSILRENGSIGDLVVVARDVSERKRLEEELGELAFKDRLTGIANRRKFDEVLESEWHRCLRGHGSMSLLLLDIDHFKGVNDRYGHQVGDDCLRTIAQTTQSQITRPADLVARYGGEEIAVILPDADMEGALEVAERMRKAIEALAIPNQDNREGNGVATVSIGVATAFSRVGGGIEMPEGLLMAADHALYKAKHGGRNRVESSVLLMKARHGGSSASAA